MTDPGVLLVLSILLPVGGVLLSFGLGGRAAEKIALGQTPLGLALSLAIGFHVAQSGAPIAYMIGGIAPPIGIALRADGFSAIMLATTALIVAAAGFYARANFVTPADRVEDRRAFTFWILLQAIWAALNIIFLSGDLFNLYVALELLTFAAVPIVSIDGRAETLAAALRYLIFALFGSVFYLLGVVLLYGGFGTLDIALLHQKIAASPLVWTAAALITAGLLAKTALVPLHLWLPPAHANAPAAASAVLSGLVVKGSFFLILRLWFYILPGLPAPGAANVLGVLGAVAVLLGSGMALRQARLKLLVAYSTLGQIGYLFFIFPLGLNGGLLGFRGGAMQILAHAFAKAAMFFSAGLVYEALGHDQIQKFRGAARALPIVFLTLALAGLSLMGLPPTGGFTAKWLMLQAAFAQKIWIWSLPILIGGLLAGGYLYRILKPALETGPVVLKSRPQMSRQVLALALALVAIALAFLPENFYALLDIGRP